MLEIESSKNIVLQVIEFLSSISEMLSTIKNNVHPTCMFDVHVFLYQALEMTLYLELIPNVQKDVW
jgi:hypothetical protein